MTKPVNYNEESITVLEGLEGVRMRPAMYIGSLEKGQFQILKECLDNCIDECLAGFSKKVGCKVEGDSFLVWDEGRGIPVGIHPKYEKEKKSTLEIIMTHLHAGGKMGSGAYEESSGLHGVGVSCSNALSSDFQVWTYRDKQWWSQTYKEGVPTSKVIKQKPEGEFTKGTVIKFTPDKTILPTPMNPKDLIHWMRNSAFLNPGIDFYIEYNGKSKTYCSKGLEDYLTWTTKDLQCEPLNKPFIFSSHNVDVALQWFENDEGKIESWCNSSPTVEGGTHLSGLLKVISKGFEDYAKKKNYKPEDLRTGLYGALNIKIKQPKFDSQTKEKLISPEAEKIVFDQCLQEFEKYLKGNKGFVKKVIDRANEIRGIYNKFVQEKKALSKLKTRGKVNLPPANKFISSNCKEASQKEIYIVEGESASGTARQARNPYNQEILKLRGKILNVAKAGILKSYESEDVLNILKAIGFDPASKERKPRVGKVIILTDADVDGKHISVLLLTLFQKVYPELLEKGMVYTVDAPLFVGKTETKEYYGESLEDLRKQYSGKFKSVTRVKGWGECQSSLLKKVAFDPATRKIQRILEVNEKELKYFYKIVGEDTEVRKKILEKA